MKVKHHLLAFGLSFGLLGIASNAVAASSQEAGPHFAEHKAVVLKVMAERQAILAQEQACVQSAATAHAMRVCAEAATASREAMKQQFKSARPKGR